MDETGSGAYPWGVAGKPLKAESLKLWALAELLRHGAWIRGIVECIPFGHEMGPSRSTVNLLFAVSNFSIFAA